jgi:ATP-binding cassette subfamily B protein
LFAFVTVALVLVAQNLRLRTAWSRQRIALTNRLVENMSAHRTRLAQQAPRRWHEGEDGDLERYFDASRQLDAGTARMAALLIRVYVITALLALVPNFLAGDATLSQLAITLGVVLSTAGSLGTLASGLTQAAAAWVAWQIIKPTLQTSQRRLGAPTGVYAGRAGPSFGGSDSTVLNAQDIHFSHHGRHGSVLRGCSLQVQRGDRILLEGLSGSGKSTFAAILAGHRSASAGFVLAGSLDRHTLGDTAWRRHIALAPQYHENHLFSASISFNLLVGRPLPHSSQDMRDAHQVCTELGLHALIDSMPAGMAQMVGDTGWRVSQGERSRIFLARALLQNAEVVVLDESLAALDPENLKLCLECVRRRAPSLILIAHP